MTLGYESGNVFKTKGQIAKVGTWTGPNFDEGGKIVSSIITPDDLKRIKSNFATPVPIYVGFDSHNGIRNPVGYAFNIELSGDGNAIEHMGFVFDQSAQVLIATGCDEISPEIITVRDDSGNVVDRQISAVCFVPSGAIEGNGLNVIVEKFSSASNGVSMAFKKESSGADNIDVSNNSIDTSGSEQENNSPTQFNIEDVVKATTKSVLDVIGPQLTDIGNFIKSQSKTDEPKTNQDVSPVSTSDPGVNAEIEKLRAKLAGQEAITDSIVTEQFDELVGSLRKLGISDADKLVSKLPKVEAVKLMKEWKDEKVLKSDMNGRGSGGSSKSVNRETIVVNTFEELGLGNFTEEYKKMYV